MVIDDAGTVILAAAAAACAATAVVRAPRRRAPALLAVALIVAAADGVHDSGALWDAAVALATGGLVLVVVERFERVSRLSWLDAAMGATSVAALALALGAAAAPAIGLGGVAGALALS